MPVVTTETIYFDGESYKLVYNVTSKGEFYLNIPPTMAHTLGINRKITADNIAALRREWKQLHGQYLEASTTTTKVIAYKLEINATIYTGEDKSEAVINRNNMHFSDGIAVALGVGVFSKETTTTGAKTNDNYTHLHSSIPESAQMNRLEYWDIQNKEIGFLEWTQEREDFFAKLVFAMENIVIKLNDFLNPEDTQKLDNLIKMNAGLLTEPGPRVDHE
jgi:hypothetical protein